MPFAPARLLRATLASLVVAVGLGACGGGGDSASTPTTTAQPAPTRKTETVRIALDYTANVNYLGIYAAIDKGYFKAQGIKPEIIPYAETSAEQLIKAGKTDLGISYPPAVVEQRASGLKYKAVAGLANENTTAIAVKADSPITRPAQLSGKTNGGFGIPSDKAILSAIMKADGAADPKYKEVSLSTAAYTALAKGRVDYAVVFEGIDDITAESQGGVKLKTFPYKRYLGDAGNYPSTVFVAGDDTIASRTDALKRALKALAQGYEFAAAQPQQAAQILVDDNKAALASSKDIVDATAVPTAKSFLDPSGKWGPLVDTDFSGVAKILGDAGLIKGTPPAPADVYTNALLPK